MRIGSRLQVFKGVAKQTSGGLKKGDLSKSKTGKIVSKKKQTQAKRKSNLTGYLVGQRRRGARVRKKPRRLGFD